VFDGLSAYPPALARAQPQNAQAAQTSASYDEQIGMTFTQSFTSMAYNVTAVQQSGTGGYGPAYLLNGLSDKGYWYQVGLSWNWNPGYYPGTGFDMVYEVWNSSGSSIFPSNGGGGLLTLSGPVNQGDIVLLSLYFTGNGLVVMRVHDWNTGASASETYQAEGATYFAGSQYSTSNSKGFFTGLMTEEYHTAPYYGNEAPVRYTDPQFALISAWMWIDEFQCLNSSCSSTNVLFQGSTNGPVTYSDPSLLQGYSLDGATEYSNAYGLVTGNLNLVPLTVSFASANGQQPPIGPTFTYVSEGIQKSVSLSTIPATYYVDNGSQWSVSQSFAGSGAGERWATESPTSGTAASPVRLVITYYDQFLVSFGYTISGGGSGYSDPEVTYYQYGRAQSAAAGRGAGTDEWADAGTSYSYTAQLSGAAAGERWATGSASGTVTSARTISPVYYHQYSVLFGYSLVPASAGAPEVTVSFYSLGSAETTTAMAAGTTEWADAGKEFAYRKDIPAQGSGARWHAYSGVKGAVDGPLSVSPTYFLQFYVHVSSNSERGGTVYTRAGWYNASGGVPLLASASPGWSFAGWRGAGAGSYTGNSTSAVAELVSGPVNETAVFEPGLTVRAESGLTVEVTYAGGGYTVAEGSTRILYVPLNATVTLTAKPASFLYAFGGWGGAASGSSQTATLVVQGPESVSASSTYSSGAVAALGAAVVATAVLVVYLARRRRG
jgi:hypothetical protein